MRNAFKCLSGPFLALVGACGADVEAVPEDAVALVGSEVITAEHLADLQARLGPYGQARFRGQHGQRALIEAAVVEELLVQEARDAKLHLDPRVEWAVLEEMASLQLAAELERRLPRHEVAEDEAALEKWHREHADRFALPEKRAFRGVRFESVEEAEEALARLRAGEVELKALGKLYRTPLTARDDEQFPLTHPVIFGPEAALRQPFERPLITSDHILVAELTEIEEAGVKGLDDPVVRDEVVSAVYEERAKPVREAIAAELAERYPEQAG